MKVHRSMRPDPEFPYLIVGYKYRATKIDYGEVEMIRRINGRRSAAVMDDTLPTFTSACLHRHGYTRDAAFGRISAVEASGWENSASGRESPQP